MKSKVSSKFSILLIPLIVTFVQATTISSLLSDFKNAPSEGLTTRHVSYDMIMLLGGAYMMCEKMRKFNGVRVSGRVIGAYLLTRFLLKTERTIFGNLINLNDKRILKRVSLVLALLLLAIGAYSRPMAVYVLSIVLNATIEHVIPDDRGLILSVLGQGFISELLTSHSGNKMSRIK